MRFFRLEDCRSSLRGEHASPCSLAESPGADKPSCFVSVLRRKEQETLFVPSLLISVLEEAAVGYICHLSQSQLVETCLANVFRISCPRLLSRQNRGEGREGGLAAGCCCRPHQEHTHCRPVLPTHNPPVEFLARAVSLALVGESLNSSAQGTVALCSCSVKDQNRFGQENVA